MKSAGNLSVFLLTAWFNTFVAVAGVLTGHKSIVTEFFISIRGLCKYPTRVNPLQPTHLVSSAGGTN
jgi:hypothetical protein